jgi:hypothetical protein
MNVIPMDQFQVRRRMDVDYQHQRSHRFPYDRVRVVNFIP